MAEQAGIPKYWRAIEANVAGDITGNGWQLTVDGEALILLATVAISVIMDGLAKAQVAELVDARRSGRRVLNGCASSSLALGTTEIHVRRLDLTARCYAKTVTSHQ